MTLLRSLAHTLLRRAGLQARRVPGGFEMRRVPHALRGGPDALSTIDVASFPIEMYASTYLAQIYAEYPHYNGEIGRLLALMAARDPNVGMIDVGASFGDTVAIAKSVADVPVLCFEGDERTLVLLERNVRQFANVRIIRTLLGERDEAINVRAEDDGGNLRLVPTDDGSRASRIEVSTLDRWMVEQPGADRYRLLKIDTEGFDCRILRGGMRFIERVKPVIAIEWHVTNMARIDEPGLPTLRQLSEVGYSTVLVYDNGGRLLVATRLDDGMIMDDLHRYARRGAIQYYDLVLFHADDRAIAKAFLEQERIIGV